MFYACVQRFDKMDEIFLRFDRMDENFLMEN